MFGYIRPLQGELKVRQYELYRGCYCGLCRTLGREYGFPARMGLNYDFTFLAMLLWESEMPVSCTARRCPVHPLRRQKTCECSQALRDAAGYSVILSWWKLRDNISDERFWRSLPARLACIGLHSAYRKAKRTYPRFDAGTRERLTELGRLEKAGESSLDRMADLFASILRDCAGTQTGDEQRENEQILYHVGRWIYIVDAADDLKKDAECGSYNPIDRRFALSGGALSEEQKQYVATTLLQSVNLAGTALELKKETQWTEILRNILYLGMASVSDAVLEGRFHPRGRGLQEKQRNITNG